MADFKALYDKLRASEMNNWVGGSDPELVGDMCAWHLSRHTPINDQTRLLDFGCGIGRVTLAMLKHHPSIKGITGIDIVPKMVDFCRDTIGSQFPNVNFELTADTNDHYERYKDGAKPKSRSELSKAYGDQFDVAYAFSVFTHVDVEDFVSLLKFVGTMMKPGGHFFFTAFALSPYSRGRIKNRKTIGSYVTPKSTFIKQDKVLIGNPDDRLAFIAYDIAMIEEMICQAGLVPTLVEYGEWRGGGVSSSLQDLFVCRKPLEQG